jgi:hypothetical protein
MSLTTISCSGRALTRFLQSCGYKIETYGSGEEILRRLVAIAFSCGG